MSYKRALSVFVVLALVAGLAFAATEPSGVTTPVSVGNETWSGGTAGGVAAQGGNISQVTLDSYIQSVRWTGFWGAASGSIALRDTSGDTFYQWAISNSSGYVFAARNATLDWSSLSADPVPGAKLDQIFNAFLAGVSDSGTNTFNESSYAATVAGVAITGSVVNSSVRMRTTGSNTWREQVLNVSNATAAATTIAFMCPINNNADSFQAATTTDFQLLVPEDETDNNLATVYYFYLQLN